MTPPASVPLPARFRTQRPLWLAGATGLAGLAAGLLLGSPQSPPPAPSAAFVPVAFQQPKGESDEPPTISVRDLRADRTIGLLGVPVGTVVKVSGEAYVGKRSDGKAWHGKTLLRITAVNDKPLPRPVTFRYYSQRFEDGGSFEPRIGDPFTVWAHERGGFSGFVGVPEELQNNNRLGPANLGMANDGFYFRSLLDVYAPVRANDAAAPRGRNAKGDL
ncbi:hypothetical protein [Alienimonas chondri]|uniref:Uncharacterized protein n=1 Tax=Alienimonas chondri TaxID=2681879 RepID=A0ABX1VGG4_9PLAN|nr:hypothetical protein [Alienimonas chondri]NNJ27131.1 hypothetical protein [Alienimonas chondri]